MQPRYLNACPACRRQYDVTRVTPGERVRCECGSTFGALHAPLRAARMLRCSNCGGNLAEHARSCEFCGAETTIEERLLGTVCPGCFARTRVDARYCMECGLEIAPQALAPVPDGRSCPRCEGRLRSRSLPVGSVVECASCGGLWVEPQQFREVCRRAGELPLPPVAPEEAGAGRLRGESSGGRYYIPCLRCGELMARRNFQGRSGVVLDLCRHHGVWLDHAELERIVAWIREHGPVRANGGFRVQLWDEAGDGPPPRAPSPALPAARGVKSGPGAVVAAVGWVLNGLLEAFSVEL